MWTMRNKDFKSRRAPSPSCCMAFLQEEHFLPAWLLQQSPSGSSTEWTLIWLLVSKIIISSFCSYWNLMKHYHHTLLKCEGLEKCPAVMSTCCSCRGAWVQFPKLTWWLTAICNSSSKGYNTLFCTPWVPGVQMMLLYPCSQMFMHIKK